jgi:hypothetical protein
MKELARHKMLRISNERTYAFTPLYIERDESKGLSGPDVKCLKYRCKSSDFSYRQAGRIPFWERIAWNALPSRLRMLAYWYMDVNGNRI